MARIELRGVCKTLEGGGPREGAGWGLAAIASELKRAAAFRIEGLELEIADGSVLAVLGPAGCGKSTLLRLIAGLMPLDAGQVLYDGVDVKDVEPGDRKIGFVFQNYALFPHFDARTNVLTYFKFRRKTPELEEEKAARYRRTAELLGVELEALLDRRPRTLSGGQQQRVAIARCITRDPRLFLLDEPFSNLDRKLRDRYRVHLRTLLREFRVTTVLVTHDQLEALTLADRIALMNEGRIEQVGTAQQIYDAPRNLFAADFLAFDADTPALNAVDGAEVSPELAAFTVGFRPEGAWVGARAAEAPAGSLRLAAEVVDERALPFRGLRVLSLRGWGKELHVRIERGEEHRAGATVPVAIPRFHLFDKRDGRRIETRG